MAAAEPGAGVTRLLLVLILLLAAGLRLHGITRAPWYDEIMTRDVAEAGIYAAVTHALYPLGYVLVYCSLLLGRCEFLLRLPSFVAGVVGVWLVYRAGRAMFSHRAGILAAVILAFSSVHILCSQEARFYSLIVAAAALCLWMLPLALATSRIRYWCWYAASVAIGLLSHVTYATFLGGGAVGAAIYCRVYTRQGNRLRQLCLLAGSTAFGMLPSIALFLYRRHLLSNMSAEPGVKITENYRLDLSEYVSFLRDLGSNFSTWMLGAMAVVLIVGLVDLWRFNKRAALVCLGFLVVSPLPLMFITLHHWYDSKYFISQLPLACLLISGGVCTLLRLPVAPKLSVLLRASLVLLGICAVTAPEFRAYLNPRMREVLRLRDWQDLATPMVSRMSANDLVVHVARFDYIPKAMMGVKGVPVERYEFYRYLADFTPKGHTPLHPLRYTGVSSSQELPPILAENADATVWVLLSRTTESRLVRELSNVMDRVVDVPRYTLYVAGEPTANLVSPDEMAKLARSSGNPGEIYCRGGSTVTLPVRSQPYRLRNGSFELWDGDRPVGWKGFNKDDHVSSAAVERTGNALVLGQSSNTIEFAQSLPIANARGARVQISAVGRAAAADELSIIWRYATPLGTSETIATHPGGNQWQALTLTCAVPAGAFPESMQLLVRANPKSGAAMVDELHVKLLSPCTVLNSQKTYVLSARLRYEGIRPIPGKFSAGEPLISERTCGFVGISGHSAGGNYFEKKLQLFDGSSDWRQLAYMLDAKDDQRLFEAQDLNVIFGAGDAQGKVWLDQVQLEMSDHPTPYTPNERLPHDEALALARAGM